MRSYCFVAEVTFKNIIYNCVELFLNESALFTYCGMVMFETIVVKQRRIEVKHYVYLHIEVLFNLNTYLFILSLSRFVARHGNVRSIFSDNRSNFMGEERELKKVYAELDDKIQLFIEGIGEDWIKQHKNPPFASHIIGVWERQIRSAHTILASMLKIHRKSLDYEIIITLMT